MKKAFLFIALALSGCTQTIFFETSHEGADIYINGKFICTAPCETEIERANKTKLITCKKEGLQGTVMKLNPVRVSLSAIDSIAYKYPDAVFCELSNPSAKEEEAQKKKLEDLKEIIQLQNTYNINNKSDLNININETGKKK